jgi:hypothetical protein
MCFSAEASFTAGTVLSVAGALSIKKAGSKQQIAFAAIPLIFGIQQLTEGFLWLALMYPDYANLQQPTTYIFLVFAQVVWPSWVPLSILLIEKDERRKRILYVMLAMGLLVSGYLAYRLLTQEITAKISGHHILYDLGFSAFIVRSFGVLYFISTVITPFFSRIKKMWSLGFTILLSYIISKIFFENYVISVWCFLAAVISISVYWVIFELNKPMAEKIEIKLKPHQPF